jgi:OmpA-OmpF porin, OOP family
MKRASRHSWPWSVSAVVLISCPLMGRAGDGPYAGIEGGVNWQAPQDQNVGDLVIDRLHYKAGWTAGVVGGYSFESGLRPELELDYRRNKFSSDLFGSSGSHDHADSALANIWYDFKAPSGLFSVVHPYLGGGAGAVRFNNNTGALLGDDDNSHYDTEFAYQAGAGIGFDVTPHLTLSLDYRHLWSNRGGFPAVLAPALVGPVSLEQRYVANTALLSVRYSFGSEPAAPVPQAPLPPPPPAPPAVVAPAPPPPPVVAAPPPPCNPPAGFKVDANCHIIDQVIVVRAVDFELNSSRLTTPAQQTLDQVAASLSAQPELKVEVQGYTDSTGALAYNMKLSQGRAESVKTYLISKGANGSSLTAHGYGPQNPIASNGTAEGRAQNRRVIFSVTSTPAHVKVDTEGATIESTEAAEQSGSSRSQR